MSVLHSHDAVPWEPLSVGATKPAVYKALGIPFWLILPVVFVPFVIVAVTWNPFWLALIPAFAQIVRRFVAKDHNRPRVLALALISGSLFADRSVWGGDSTDPLGPPGETLGDLRG